jgi:tripartite-type tricarboxylate transporter receptor subunit TctC
LKDLIALAKENPGKLNGSSSGIGSSSHLALELLKATTGVNISHVPYRGQAEALNDVIAGRIDMTFSSVGTVKAQLKAGKLRAIAIGSPERFEGLPDVQTIAEQGYPGFDVSAWHGLLMPAVTPPDIVARVNAEVTKALKSPDVAGRMRGLGYVPVGGPPEVLDQTLKSDTRKWGKLIHDAAIQAD